MKNQLTLPQQQVLEILKLEDRAMTAYALLEKVKHLGFHAPTQVYRVLKKLMDYGVILRLDSLNMYVACELTAKSQYQLVTICTVCQKAKVVETPQLAQFIQQSIYYQNFNSKQHHLELLGQCDVCCSKHQDISLTTK